MRIEFVLTLSAGGLLVMPASALAQCVLTSGVYQCSNANSSGISINAASATVTTNPGFSVGTPAAPVGSNALTIQGAGALSYTDTNASSLYSTARGLSIVAGGDNGSTPGSVTVQTGGDITGTINGISVQNGTGSGTTSVTATGTVSATQSYGILVTSGTSSTGVTVSAGTVTGGTAGISVTNQGSSGATSVVTTGVVTGGAANSGGNNGITATNAGTDLTVTAQGNVNAGFEGILAQNNGSGTTSVTAGGTVTSTGNIGIYVANAASATGMTLGAAGVSGANTGIYASNLGGGATQIVATGTVEGTQTNGIQASAAAKSGAMSISANAVTGGTTGILASNLGSGATSITATGVVTGGSALSATYGINATNAGTDLTIDAQKNVSAGFDGILAQNNGTGATSVTVGGTVTTGTGPTATGTGVYVANTASAKGGVTIDAAGVSAARTGIYANNLGTADTQITTTGQVTGTTSYGIQAVSAATSGAMSISANTVTGGVTGITASNLGSGATSITTTGVVSGGTASPGTYGINVTAAGADSTGAGLLIQTQANVSAGFDGISAQYNGTGRSVIQAGATVSGGANSGIISSTSAASTGGLFIQANNATGGMDGIFAANAGSGLLSIQTSGSVVGTTIYGISAQSTGSGAVRIESDGNVSGELNAIRALSNGTDIDITTNGVTQTLAGNASDLVMYTSGGATSITNSGTLTGQVQTDGTGVNTLSNSGTWNTAGSAAGNSETGLTGVVNSGAINFIQASGTDTFAAPISGTGTIDKTGAGTTILTGNSTYTGTTAVNAGGLYIYGNQTGATGVTSVANGATLGGTGTVGGNVTVATGGTLSPGTAGNAVGTLTINGDLSLAAGSTLAYSFGQANVVGGAFNDLVNVGGSLTLAGTLNISASSGGTFGPGVYRVINYGGALTDNGLTLGSLPSGASASNIQVQTAVANQVNLINAAGLTLNVWDGAGPKDDGVVNGGTGVWQAAAGNDNWTTSDGTVNAPWSTGSFAIFEGAAGTVTVDNSQGQVTVAGMQLAANGYQIGGDALTLLETTAGTGQSIIRVGDGAPDGANYTATIASVLQGSTQLVKTDLGTLVLTGANTYTGGTAIDGGTLSISEDANLGDAAGALSFDGGTLNTTASFTTARATTLDTGGGTLDVDSGTTLTVSSVIDGVGSLTKTGSGTLVLTNANTYTGGTAIDGGTLSISGDANLGDVAGALSFDGGTLNTTASFTTARATTLNTGGGTLDIDSGTTLTMSGAIEGSGSLAKTDAGTLVLTGVNTYSGGTTISGGTLQLGTGGTSGSIQGDVVDNGALVFDRSDAVTFGGVISGSGAVNQAGSGTLTLTGDNTYTGATTVAAGTLAVNGSVANSTVTVNAGATLSGIGTVGGIAAQSGATIAPGKAGSNGGIGTLNVAGNVTFDTGSTYQVALNPSTASLIKATGAATIEGGTVSVLAGSGNYSPVYTYTILSASGGVTGAFAGVTTNLAFLTPSLTYDANAVYLTTIRNDVSFASVGNTPNQSNVGSGVESLGPGSPLYVAVIQLNAESARSAFQQLAGGIYASARAVLTQDSHFVRDAAFDRLRDGACGVSGGTTALAVDDARITGHAGGQDTRPDTGCDADQRVVWSRVFGSWGHTSSDGNAAGLNRDTGGFLSGVDGPLFDHWRGGLLAGYSYTNLAEQDLSSYGSSDGYTVGLYLGRQWGNWSLRTGAAYTWNVLNTDRNVSFQGFAGQLRGSYDSGTAQPFAEVSYGLKVGKSALLEPFANVAYVNLHTDGFTEQGGAAALSSASSNASTTFSTLGLRGSGRFTLDSGALSGLTATVTGSLGWRHAFGDVTPIAALAFANGANGAGNTFNITGAPIAGDAAVIDTGIDFAVGENATVGLSYDGQFGSGFVDNGVRADFKIRF